MRTHPFHAEPSGAFRTNVDKSVVASPAIGVDDAVEADLSPDNLLQRGLRTIGDYFSVYAAIAFEDAKDGGFSVSASSPFALDASSAKE